MRVRVFDHAVMRELPEKHAPNDRDFLFQINERFQNRFFSASLSKAVSISRSNLSCFDLCRLPNPAVFKLPVNCFRRGCRDRQSFDSRNGASGNRFLTKFFSRGRFCVVCKISPLENRDKLRGGFDRPRRHISNSKVTTSPSAQILHRFKSS